MNKSSDSAELHSLCSRLPTEFSTLASLLCDDAFVDDVVKFSGDVFALCDLKSAKFKTSQQWLHVAFSSISNEPIGSLDVKFKEQTQVTNLGTKMEFIFDFPSEYADFLGFFNGLRLFAGRLQFSGMDDSPQYRIASSSDFVPPSLAWDNTLMRPAALPANYVVIGNYMHRVFNICWDIDTDVICAIHETDSTPLAQWKNFTTFCELEIPRIASLLPRRVHELREFPPITPGGL